jgi:hypothetical protein
LHDLKKGMMRGASRALVCGVALALIVAAGCADRSRVQTSRVEARALATPEETAEFQFVIFGDRTGGPAEGIKVLEEAVRGTNLLDPDFVMTVGDLIQGYNATPEWMEQMQEFRRVMGGLEMPWYPVAGNHDIYWRGEGEPPPGHHESNYEKHFGPLWYWFPHKNAAFIVLYSDEGNPETNEKGWKPGQNRMGEAQLDWLRDTLRQTADMDHVFVFLHHPKWHTEAYAGTNWDDAHGLLSRAGNVRAVFAGHIHRQRYDGVRDGIAYHTLATTGGYLDIEKPAPGSGWLHHMNVVTVRKSGIEMATIPVGEVIDPKTMTPEFLADVDLARRLRMARLSPPIRVNADGSAHGELRYRLVNIAKRAISATLSLRGDGWLSTRDRVELEPGAAQEVALHVERRPERAGNAVPDFVVDVEYPGQHRSVRITSSRIAPVYASRGISAPAKNGHPGYAAFEGKGGGVRIAHDDMGMPDGPFTVEAWVRPDKIDRRRFIAAKGAMPFTGQQGEFHLILSRGRPQFYVRLDGTPYPLRAFERLSPGAWHHIAGVFDGKEVRLYVSGELKGRMDASGTRTRNTQPFIVGAGPPLKSSGRFSYAGGIDEVRLSMTARYTGPKVAVDRSHTPDAETFLLLKFDQPRLPVALDSSPNRRHGILSGISALAPE